MATATETENEDYVDFDQYIDFQVNRTRTQIRSTDLMTAAAGGVSIVLAYLLIFVVLDHWVIPGGFSSTMRWVLLAGVLAIIGGWTWLRLSKPYFSKVSRLFAARELEDASEEMRSSLMTLVDLRDNNRKIQPEIQDALEKRAAKNLSTMDVEEAIDRKGLLQVFYMLLVVVLIFCTYAIFSPKKISTSIWRALLPVASIEVPTKTTIVDVDPGDHNVLARSLLDVSVYLSGDTPDEVTLYYTTDDRRYVDEPILMREVKDVDGKFTCLLSGENGRGLLQNHTYRIVAGDAESGTYTITVKQAPIATINSVELEFPKYMDLPPRKQSSGDIDAWEGTVVELKATTSMPVKSAIIRFSDSEDLSQKAEEIPLKITNGNLLSARWRPLEFRTDGSYPKYYRIECRNEAGDTDPSPSLYHLKIRPDQSPEVKLLAPRQDIERPSNAIVPMIIRAHDPDFKLRYLTLRIEKDGESIFSEPIFDGNKKKVTLTHNLKLEPLRLKTDDEITFWIEARDNKQPLGNRKNSTRLKIRIIDPLPTPEDVQKDFEKTKEQQIQDLIQQGEDTEGVEEETNKKELTPPEEKEKPFPQPKENKDENKENSADDKGKPEENSNNKEGGTDENNSSESMKGNSSENNSDKSQDESKQSESSNGKGEEKLKPAYNPDGSDDDAVLEKMIRDELERQKKENNPANNRDSENKQDSSNNKDNTKTPDSKNRESMKEPSENKSDKLSNPDSNTDDKKSDKKSNLDNNKENSDKEEPTDKNSKNMTPDNSDENKSNDPKDNSNDANSNKESTENNSNKNESSEHKSNEMNSEKSKDENASSNDQSKSDQKSSEKTDANKETPTGLNDKNKKPGDENKSSEKSDSKSNKNNSEKMNPDGKPKNTEPSEKNKEDRKGNPDGKKPNKTEDQDKKPGKQPSKQNPKPGDKKSSKPNSDGKKPSETPKNGKGNPQEKSQEKNPSDMKPGDPKKSDNKAPTGKKPTDQKQTEKKSDGKKPGDKPSDGKKSDAKKSENGKPSDKKSEGDKKSDKGKEGGGKKSGDGKKPGDKPGRGKPGDGKGDSKKPGDGKGKGKSGKPGQGKGKPSDGQSGGKPKGPDEPTEDGKKSNGGSGMSKNIPDRNDGNHTAGGHGNAKEDPNAKPEGPGGPSDVNTPESIEDRKKAANLVLKKMEENSKEANDKLLKELGWTEKQLADFRERMSKHLKKKEKNLTQEEIIRKRQFEEMLRNMDLKQKKPAEIQGGKFEKSNVDSFAPGGDNAPPQYRELEEAFKRSLSRKRSKN